MKIKVEKGSPVDLDAKRRTSVKGGVYDISELEEADQKRLLKLKGVSKITAPKSSKKES